VAKCKVLVLPYIEASQSGLIPIAHAFGKPVVVNSVGGLPEQVIDGLNGYKCHLGDSFSDLVNLAFRKEWSFEVENPSKSQYELFLTCISDSS
jgi:glycosyltransferase involved in cell wall biosynthesis